MENSAGSSTEDLARSIASCTITPKNAIQTSQIVHRLNILQHWFGDTTDVQNGLKGRRILEIGCGQGDMTVTLAHMVAASSTASPLESVSKKEGKVLALDPAPLTYGTPYTLGQSQGHVSRSRIGPVIEWIQRDPVEYLTENKRLEVNFIVIAHALFYLESELYLEKLLAAIQAKAKEENGLKNVKLLVAEWSMRHSTPKAEAHVQAVLAQSQLPLRDGNVRTLVTPERFKTLAQQFGLGIERENWIVSPDIDDASWEVKAATTLRAKRGVDDEVTKHLNRVEEVLGEDVDRNGRLATMDVWTCVFALRN